MQSTEDWVLHAGCNIAEQDHAKKLMFGTAGAIALGGFTGVPILGALVFAGSVFWTLQANRQKVRSMRVLAETQTPAPFLNGEDFEQYRRFVGDDIALIEEYKQVQPFKDLAISHDMEDLIDEKAPHLLDGDVSQPLAQPLLPVVAKDLGMLPLPTKAKIFDTPEVETAIDTYDLAKDMGEHPQTALIVGVPGAGKGMLFSNALRYAKAKYPNLQILGVDPKNDPKETGYWERGFNVVYRQRMDHMQPDAAVAWIERCLAAFAQLPTPKLLLLDEGALVNQYFKLSSDKQAFSRLQAFITALISSGDSRGEYLWFVSQMANCNELGYSGGFRSLFRAVAIASTRNLNATNALLNTKFVPLPPGGIDDVMKLIAQSPVQRAFFDGKTNRWYTMAALPNHSERDRDNDSLLRSQESSTTPELPEPPKEGVLSAIAKTVRRQLAAEDIDFDLESLPPHLKEIALYSIKKSGWVKARACKSDISLYHRDKAITTEHVREHFQQLSDRGCGVCRGASDQLQYSAFKQDGSDAR